MTAAKHQQGSHPLPILRRWGRPWRKFVSRQTRYSFVSALFSLTLALRIFVDSLIGQPQVSHELSNLSLIGLLVLALISLTLGRHFPWWMGILFIACFALWSAASLITSNHPHVELNVLLYAPVVAVYLGWFYPTWLARLSMFIYLGVVSLAIVKTSHENTHEFSSALALTYAVLISWFALETGMYLRRRAKQESQIDSLTGALNRRGLMSRGRSLLTPARRHQEAYTIVAIDFDSFKSLNDTDGHAAGDAALSVSVSLWRAALGPGDLIARVGGDEFILLLRASVDEALELMETMSSQAPYLWSWGASAIDSATSLQQALVEADSELYRAKARRSP